MSRQKVWNLITFGILMKSYWQASQNCVLLSQRNIFSRTICWQTCRFPHKFQNLAKNFLQLCQKCIIIARTIYSTKTFLIEKPKFSKFGFLHCVALFDSWREGFNTVVKAAFFLSRVLFWRKILSDRRFCSYLLSRFWRTRFGWFVKNAFYVLLYVTRKTFRWKA